MSETDATATAQTFRAWLRQEFRSELKLSVILLAAGLVAVYALDKFWPGFNGPWNRFNYQLSSVAVNQHPLAHTRIFAGRLNDSEYGWRLLSWSAPFNVTAAREELQRDYPEVIGVFDGRPVVPRESSLRRLDSARYERRIAAFMARHQAIERYRFTWLYGGEDAFSLPQNSAVLGRIATKLIGLPDALLFTLYKVVSAGLASILLFSAVLGLSAVALRAAKRPARPWIKVVLWPLLGSALVWVAIIFMAFAAAAFGWATPNTSGLAFFSTLPLQLLAAKIPFRYAEGLLLKVGPNASAREIIRTLTRSPFSPDI